MESPDISFSQKCAEKISCGLIAPLTTQGLKGIAKLIDDELRPCAQEAAEKISQFLWEERHDYFDKDERAKVADIILNCFNKKGK